jgi:hypothetical protein
MCDAKHICRLSTEDPVKSMENTGYIRYAVNLESSSVNIRVASLESREAYKQAWLQGPSAVVALPAACRVNTGPYRGTTLYSPYFRPGPPYWTRYYNPPRTFPKPRLPPSDKLFKSFNFSSYNYTTVQGDTTRSLTFA